MPETDGASPRPRWRLAAWLRRLLLTTVVLGQTAVATLFLQEVLPYHGGNPEEWGLLALFALLYGWISVGFWIGVTGFFVRRFGGDPRSLLRRHPPERLAGTPLAPTAVIMPIYHEPVHHCLAGLAATWRSLAATGALEHFEFHILSDSRRPEHWLAEQEAWHHLCGELNAAGRMFYRRRILNLHYKSGNVADFLRRFGRRYTYAVVLDADSLMSGETLVRLVQLMQREPQVGILQTNPGIVHARSLFARAQQFANQVYGPLFSSGLAAFQLGEATYWGHNAILRVQPFMAHCGLRKLTGPGLFQGPVSSHDFVEAAYMGRAGHEVWLEPALGGSHEESPPALGEELARDRRWAKGNLQHLWLLFGARRLRLAHRMAFVNGIMSYLASPLWLLFLILSTVAASRMVLFPIDYFPTPHSPFPRWPQWRPELALQLALSTVFLLFFPKLLAVLDVVASGRLRAMGGWLRLNLSLLIESLLSALFAPIRMLAHSRHVLEALANRSLRWAGQNRGDETRWPVALLEHAPGAVLAAGWAGFAWWLDAMFFWWSLPVAIPLMLAAPITVLTSRIGPGEWLRRRRVLTSVAEGTSPGAPDAPPDIARAPDLEVEAWRRRLAALNPGGFADVVIDPRRCRQQIAWARPRSRGAKARQVERLLASTMRDGPGFLTPRQQALLLEDSEALRQLHGHAWSAPCASWWGQAVGRHLGTG